MSMYTPTEQEIVNDIIDSIISNLEQVKAGTRTTGWGDSTDLEDNLRDIAERLIFVSQRGYADAFEGWMRDTFDTDDIRGIAEHGANTGWHHLTYYSHMLPIYDKYHDEIWVMLDEDYAEFGYENAMEFIASWNSDPMMDIQFKGALVHYAAERTAQRIVDELDEEGEDDE